MKKYILPVILGIFTITLSCSDDFKDDVSDIRVQSGTADFTHYVAVGNALTSGYRDGALYIDGQKLSYPAILAEQMKLSGGAQTFNTPLMNDNLGGIPAVPNVESKFILIQKEDGSLGPVRLTDPGTTTLANIYAQGPYQNMGIPGARLAHLLAAGYGDPANLSAKKANPYYVRFSSSPSATVIGDAVAQNPTFFSLWVGNNDVLRYASTGGDGTEPITPTADFANYYNLVVQKLTANGAKGVTANIPEIYYTPHFTTVPSKPFTVGKLADATIDNLNINYANYNAGVQQALAGGKITNDEASLRTIKFEKGKVNGAIILDSELTDLSSTGLPAIRLSNENDLLLLAVSGLLSKGFGTQTPLEDKYVLTPGEIKAITEATQSYNNTIKQVAAEHNLAFVDANDLMKRLNTPKGLSYDGLTFSTKFVTGGAFSLDGIHLTGKGYAIIANTFINAINKQYGATLPTVSAANDRYQGVGFP